MKVHNLLKRHPKQQDFLIPPYHVTLGLTLLDNVVSEGMEKNYLFKNHDVVKRSYDSLTRYEVCCWMVYPIWVS